MNQRATAEAPSSRICTLGHRPPAWAGSDTREGGVEAANEHVPEKLEGCGIQAFRDYAVRAAALPSGTSRRTSGTTPWVE